MDYFLCIRIYAFPYLFLYICVCIFKCAISTTNDMNYKSAFVIPSVIFLQAFLSFPDYHIDGWHVILRLGPLG